MSLLPMLATPSTGASGLHKQSYADLIDTGLWVGDLKLDGIRAFAHWDGKQVTFTNRTGADITRKFPEVADVDLGSESLWLDGEIVAVDGRFETVLTRDKQERAPAIRRLASSHPCRFMAFDIPEFASWPYVDRRAALEELLEDRVGTFGLTVVSDSPTFLDLTREAGLEGVILKRKGSTYQFGKRSRSWVKFKNLHRVTCLVAGYAPGTGHRAHFGAMDLALVTDGGDLTLCGRVGTGFSEREIAELKARLDGGEVLVVEIECLNRTSGGQLRFPVYKGVRGDIDVLACTTKQLDALPVC